MDNQTRERLSENYFDMDVYGLLREMFELADESYAVENAVPELKELATGIIWSNDADGVARGLEKACCLENMAIKNSLKRVFIHTLWCH